MQASFLAEAGNVEEELRSKRNANSVYQGARSVFAEQPMEHYEAQGLKSARSRRMEVSSWATF